MKIDSIKATATFTFDSRPGRGGGLIFVKLASEPWAEECCLNRDRPGGDKAKREAVMAALIRDKYGPPGDVTQDGDETITRWWIPATLIKSSTEPLAWSVYLISRAAVDSTPIW